VCRLLNEWSSRAENEERSDPGEMEDGEEEPEGSGGVCLDTRFKVLTIDRCGEISALRLHNPEKRERERERERERDGRGGRRRKREKRQNRAGVSCDFCMDAWRRLRLLFGYTVITDVTANIPALLSPNALHARIISRVSRM